jgi:hypothetical protein
MLYPEASVTRNGSPIQREAELVEMVAVLGFPLSNYIVDTRGQRLRRRVLPPY